MKSKTKNEISTTVSTKISDIKNKETKNKVKQEIIGKTDSFNKFSVVIEVEDDEKIDSFASKNAKELQNVPIDKMAVVNDVTEHLELRLKEKHRTHEMDRRQLADFHLKKMPYITSGKSKQRLVAWTDLKEILFPSCSHPKCDIVLNALKLKLRYPWKEDTMHACTPKEHVAFLRKYRIVPSGVLLVDIDRLKSELEEIWEMVRIKHQNSEDEYSRKCHYAKAQLATGSDHADDSRTIATSSAYGPDYYGSPTKPHEKESECTNTGSGKDRVKSMDEIEKTMVSFSTEDAKLETIEMSVDLNVVHSKKIKLPCLRLDDEDSSNPSQYVPAYLAELCFPNTVAFLIRVCRDHLVSRSSRGTHCCSVDEGRAFTRWMCKVYGWSQNWRHITSRDVLVRRKDLEDSLKNASSDEMKAMQCGFMQQYCFDINDLASVPKPVPISTIQNNRDVVQIADGHITPQGVFRQPKKRLRIKSPTDPDIAVKQPSDTDAAVITQIHSGVTKNSPDIGISEVRNLKTLSGNRRTDAVYMCGNTRTDVNISENMITDAVNMCGNTRTDAVNMCGNTRNDVNISGYTRTDAVNMCGNTRADAVNMCGNIRTDPVNTSRDLRTDVLNMSEEASFCPVRSNVELDLLKETGILSVQNTNNSALTDKSTSGVDRNQIQRCPVSSGRKKPNNQITELEVRAFGKLSKPPSVNDTNSKMAIMEDKFKLQFEVNRSKMKLLEERILKKLEESRASRDKTFSPGPHCTSKAAVTKPVFGNKGDKAGTFKQSGNENVSGLSKEIMLRSQTSSAKSFQEDRKCKDAGHDSLIANKEDNLNFTYMRRGKNIANGMKPPKNLRMTSQTYVPENLIYQNATATAAVANDNVPGNTTNQNAGIGNENRDILPRENSFSNQNISEHFGDGKQGHCSVPQNISPAPFSQYRPLVADLIQNIPLHPEQMSPVPSPNQIYNGNPYYTFNQMPMLNSQYYPYGMMMSNINRPLMFSPLNSTTCQSTAQRPQSPCPSNMMHNPQMPNQSYSACSTTNRNRLQQFYYPPENAHHVTFQPFGSWPRCPPCGKNKYYSLGKVTANTAQNEQGNGSRSRGATSLKSAPIPHQTALEERKTADNSGQTEQTLQKGAVSGYCKSDCEKTKGKNKTLIQANPKLPNDLVGAIVEESVKSMAKISNMAAAIPASKSDLKSQGRSSSTIPVVTLIKHGAEMEVSSLTQSQPIESENSLLALVSANPFTQSLESLKAMKDVMSKEKMMNETSNVTKAQKLQSGTRQKGVPIQRNYGCLGCSTDSAKKGLQSSESTEELTENLTLIQVPKSNSSFKDGRLENESDQSQTREDASSNHTSKYFNRKDIKTNSNVTQEQSIIDEKNSQLSRKGKHPEKSKSHSCVSSESERKKKATTPARQSSSLPSLGTRRRSLFGELHKDYDSYESIPGEDLKMTFIRIKDGIDKDIKVRQKSVKKTERPTVAIHTSNESEKSSRKDEKMKPRESRRKPLTKSRDDEQIDLDDMESILSVMQRSYKRHENTKVRQSSFSSLNSYYAAENVYKASKSKLKFPKRTDIRSPTPDGKVKSIGSYRLDNGTDQRNVPELVTEAPELKKRSPMKNADLKPNHYKLSQNKKDSYASGTKRQLKAYDECKNVFERLSRFSKENQQSLDRRANEPGDTAKHAIILKQRVRENVKDENQKDFSVADDKDMESGSHPKKRWMKEFMVCAPQKIERIASMDLLALEDEDRSGPTREDEWSKDLSNFVQCDISLNSSACNTAVTGGGKQGSSPPVLQISNVSNTIGESLSKSPPMPQLELIKDNELVHLLPEIKREAFQLEMIKDCDFSVDHEEEIGSESCSKSASVSSPSLSENESTDHYSIQVVNGDTVIVSSNSGTVLSSNTVDYSGFKECDSVQAKNKKMNSKKVLIMPVVKERHFHQPENDLESDLEGSLFILDDAKTEGEIKLLRRSARQSITPTKTIKTEEQTELGQIYGSKMQIGKPSPTGKRKKVSKSANRKTSDKKNKDAKGNKESIKRQNNNKRREIESRTEHRVIQNDLNSWQNVVKEQKVMLDIIKRTTPKKETHDQSLAKCHPVSEESEEVEERAQSRPPCNTPCSISDENVFEKELMRTVSKYGYGDGCIGITESFQQDREDFANFCMKLENETKRRLSSFDIQDYNASGDVDKFFDSVTVKKEGFMKPDAYGFLYEPIKNDYGLSKGGLIYHDKMVIPYVMINGYKYVAVVDILQLFSECVPKCVIPRNILHKHRGLFKSYCNWEQVYVLDLLYVKRGRSLKTGDMLLRFDIFLKHYEELRQLIREKHKNTTYKRSQNCNYIFN